MLVLDNGDAIRGIAEVATQLDFIVNGYVGTTATQLADGQLGTSEGDLYLSGADATVVTSITIVNRDSAARTFTLHLKPSGGTSRAISPVSLDLGIGHSFYTDGQRITVIDKDGNLLTVATVSAHKDDHDPNTGSDPLDTAVAGTIQPDDSAATGTADSLSRSDHKHAIVGAVPSAILEVQAQAEGSSSSFVRADHAHAIVHDITDNSLVTVDGPGAGAPASGEYAKFTASGLEGKSKAEQLSDLNVADGADVTGSNAPQAHKASHETGGADEINDVDINAGTIGGVTLDGDLTLDENAGLVLNAALSADGKYSGIVEAGTAGAVLAFGDLVYLAVVDSRWELTDADAVATSFGKIGICVLVAAGDGGATTILLWGKVRADAVFPALTIGAPVHIGTVAGDVQVSAPVGTGDIVRIIGYGNTADELFFCPDNTYVELV